MIHNQGPGHPSRIQDRFDQQRKRIDRRATVSTTIGTLFGVVLLSALTFALAMGCLWLWNWAT